MRARALADELGDQAASLYRKGLTITEVAAALEVTRKPVVTALRKRRVQMRPTGRQPKRTVAA